MKKNLKNTTFLIPINLESNDRIRNCYIVLNYLLSNFDTNIIIKEVDTYSKFTSQVLPFLPNTENIIHLFETIPDSGIFHKSRYINDMFEEVKTDVVANYDIDVILPIEAYLKSQQMCLENYDLVYPFAYGENQIMLYTTDLTYIRSKPHTSFEDITQLALNYKRWASTYGHVQFFKSESFKNGFMMNENFSSYSPEDIEIGTRYDKLNYNIGRTDNIIIHIEHSRGVNSSKYSPATYQNNLIWNTLKEYNKEQLIDYYNNQEYYKNRINKNDKIR